MNEESDCLGGEVGLKGGLQSLREETRESVKTQTPVFRLAILRRLLIAKEYVRYVNTTGEELRDTLSDGALVGVHGSLTVSAFSGFVEMASKFLSLVTAFDGLFGAALKVDVQTEQAVRYLETVAGRGIAVYVQPEQLATSRRGFDFACILNTDDLRVSASDLGGRVNLLARVKKILARSEVIYLYELIPGMAMLPGTELKALTRKLTESPGFRISERDLRLRYPTVLLAPIAMYP